MSLKDFIKTRKFLWWDKWWQMFRNVEIDPLMYIGQNLRFPHGHVIVAAKSIGDNVTIYQFTTIGSRRDHIQGLPTIEDNVTIYEKCSIFGPVTIGHNSTILSGARITKDVPPYSIVRDNNKIISTAVRTSK